MPSFEKPDLPRFSGVEKIVSLVLVLVLVLLLVRMDFSKTRKQGMQRSREIVHLVALDTMTLFNSEDGLDIII